MLTRRHLLCSSLAAAAAAALGSAPARADMAPGTIYLTSDDGPEPGTPALLDIIDAAQVPLALFFIGKNAAVSPLYRASVERARGNSLVTLGNHSYSHCLMHYAASYRNPAAMVADFRRAADELNLGGTPAIARGPGRNVWRLPDLCMNDRGLSKRQTCVEQATYDQLFDAGFRLYGWDVEWPHDGRGEPMISAQQFVERITHAAREQHRPGQTIVLMHDVMFRTRNGRDYFARAVGMLKDRGYNFGRIEDYLSAEEPAITAGITRRIHPT